MVCWTFINAVDLVLIMLLYERVPSLSPYPMMFMRSLISLCLLLVILNVNLKKKVWDNIKRKDALPFIARTYICGTVKNMINFEAARYVPGTFV